MITPRNDDDLLAAAYRALMRAWALLWRRDGCREFLRSAAAYRDLSSSHADWARKERVA